jgi:phosphate-selective porin OprO/OprP
MLVRKRAFVGLLLLVAFCIAGTAMPNAVHAQEASNEAPSTEEAESIPDEPDRLSRIEEQLRKLESRNNSLQKRYDDLQRQYNSLRRQATEPVFGAQMGNTDGKGIPNGVQFDPSFVMQKKASKEGSSGAAEGREQTGEGGAGEQMDQGKRRTFEPEEGESEEGEEEPVVPGVRPRTRRRQSGVSGAGVSAGPESPRQSMEAYVNMLGTYQPNMRPPRLPLTASFSQGMELRSDDEFFTVEFHNLSQLDYRDFSNTGAALHDNFFIPRQRWYFQGQLTPYAYYYTVINRGYGSLDLLDSWADFNFWPRYKEYLQIRVGRSKVPFNYEYIKVSESDLIAPERSILVGNFSGNRQDGVMLHGQVLERSLEYYVGLFNGPQRSFVSYTNSKTLYTFLNAKPFLHSGIEWLEHLNLSGSWNGGTQRDPLQPAFLTTANDQSPSATTENVSPTFLVFNNHAFENGMRMFWGGDVAYYYKSFTMYAGYQGGFVNYSLYGQPLPANSILFDGQTAFAGIGSSQRTTVPISGWNVALTYFITGEEITRRVYLVEPKRPFGFYNGKLNPGAIELYARFANIQLGDQIFTGGIANPQYWTNRASATDIGTNWYLNNYVRIYLDWQHAMFGSPVFLDTNKYTKHENLYWLRTQIFF